MNILKKLAYSSIVIGTAGFLSACFAPAFYSTVSEIKLDNGSDVTFTVSVANNPTTVTCFDTNLALTNTSGDSWEGTAVYGVDITELSSGETPGVNTVNCTSTNNFGTATQTLGTITLIPNVAPTVVALDPIDVCSNSAERVWDEPTVDTASSTYIATAEYTLTAGTLPDGLLIQRNTGKIVGTPTVQTGDFTANGLKITATTLAGNNESAPFSVSGYAAASCP